MSQIITEPGSSLYKVTETLTYDNSGGSGFGNLTQDSATGVNVPTGTPATRSMVYGWSSGGQFLTSLKDPSGAATSWTYSSSLNTTFGVPDSSKDPNGLTTSWLYDPFGRKAQETRPDGTYTTWNYYACSGYVGCVVNSAINILHDVYGNNNSLQSWGIAFQDSVDRPLVNIQTNLAGGYTRNELRYNSLGRISENAFPCVYTSLATTCTSWATNKYDFVNRITSVTRPISSTNSNTQTTNYSYAGRTSYVYDPYGYPQSIVTDVNGWLRRATDAFGYTVSRAYDAAGSLTGITDSVGNSLLKNVTVAYGLRSFVTAATDADRGPWSYTIDSFGERTAWTDAKGQNFSMSYDALSRPLTRTEPDLFTEWNYGSAAPNWGRLTGECTAAESTTNQCNAGSWLYDEVRAYDSVARLSTRTITQSGNTGGNDGSGSFVFTYGYNATTGLLSSLTYPKSSASTTALNISYGYQYGLLNTVTDTTDLTGTCGSSCTLWTANTTDSFGHVTQETAGNGVVTARSFDAVTSWLTKATAGVGGGSALLNQSYAQDWNGNIVERQDNNAGLTESFAYDEDHRLTCSALASSCSTPTIVYDGGSAGPGNITSQTGVGTYSYPAAGQPLPHAVTSLTGTFNGITNPSFGYDQNGDMTQRASSSQNVYWWTSNYPASITGSDATGTEVVTFAYGPDRQRWGQQYSGPSGLETTYYVGGGAGPAPALLEVVFNSATTYRYYIYAGNEPIAVYSRSGSTYTMNYMLADHQASVSTFASSTGSKDVSESFSAFGQRRNPTSWSGPPTTSDLNTIAGLSRQGYTMQTWLGQSMGLNHMNGRVEDAILGRMLSPDPHIPDPTNAQSYNRYSYVYNNPLSMLDPTGFAGILAPDLNWGGGGIGTLGDGLLTYGGQTSTGYGPGIDDLVALAGLADSLDALAANGLSGFDSSFNSWTGTMNAGVASTLSGLASNIAQSTDGDGGNTSAVSTAGSGGVMSGPAQSQTDPTNGGAQIQPATCPAPCLAPITVTASGSSSDAAIVYPQGFGQGYANTLSLPLAPGANSLMITVKNIDASLAAQVMASTGVPVRLTLNLNVQTVNGLISGSQNFSQALAPGDSTFFSVPGFVGPGQAALEIINTGGYTTAVVFTATPQVNSGAGP